MPYGTFMVYNALGAVCWAVIVGTLGYLFGRNLPQLERYMGQATLAGVLLVALVVGLALGWRWFVRNRDRLVERTQLVWQRVLTTPGLQELKVRYPRAWTFVAARFARGEYLGLHLTVGFVISLAGLWLFGGVTEDVIHHDPLTQFDMALLDWLHRHATPTGYAIFHAITLLGSPVTLTVLALGVGLLLATRRQWILLGGWLTAFAGGGVLDEVLKLVIRRPRPPWPRDGLAHRLRHARLRAGSALDPSPERADLGGAGRRPADRGYRTESTLPRRPLLQRRGGWLRRRGLVALRVYLWPRGRAWVARRGTAGRNSTDAGLRLPEGRRRRRTRRLSSLESDLRGISCVDRLLFAALGLALAPPSIVGQAPVTPYRVTWRDAVSVGTAGVLYVLPGALGLPHGMPSCAPCEPATLPGVDRWALHRVSATGDAASDVVLAGAAGLTAFAGLHGLPAQQWRGNFAVFANTASWTAASTEWLKVLVRRKRPVLYTSDAVMARSDPESQQSLPSLHTSLAFAAATSYLVIARRQHLPHRTRNTILLYAGAVGVAALRVAAGMHFPTDVLAGAALGSGIGWLVPTIHPIQP